MELHNNYEIRWVQSTPSLGTWVAIHQPTKQILSAWAIPIAEDGDVEKANASAKQALLEKCDALQL